MVSLRVFERSRACSVLSGEAMSIEERQQRSMLLRGSLLLLGMTAWLLRMRGCKECLSINKIFI